MDLCDSGTLRPIRAACTPFTLSHDHQCKLSDHCVIYVALEQPYGKSVVLSIHQCIGYWQHYLDVNSHDYHNIITFLWFSSSVTYAPNSEYLLVSTLDSKHRLFATKHGGSLPGSPAPMYVKAYKSHINKKYSIFSSISTFHNGDVTGSYLASGSEDNMVR